MYRAVLNCVLLFFILDSGLPVSGENLPTGTRPLQNVSFDFLKDTLPPLEAIPDLTALSGATSRRLSISPKQLSFPFQKLKTVSVAKKVTLKNVGTSTVTFAGFAIGGTNNGSFTQTHSCGKYLQAGKTCYAYVRFAPKLYGKLTAALVVKSNGSGSPQSVGLSGNEILGCVPVGSQCRPEYPCCPGLTCVATSVRPYCR